MGTKSQYRITMSSAVDGYSYGVWDKKTGGDVQATITKHRPGGMGPEETYGGQTEITDITLTRVKKRADRDDLAVIRRIRANVGRERVVVVEQPLDSDANSFGTASVHNGILMRIAGADVDSTSNDADMYEVGVSLNGTIA